MTVAEAQALPALCGPKEMAGLFRISQGHFYKLNKRGAFDRFKVTPAMGPKCFSGILLARYLASEPLLVPTFGRKRA